MGSVGGTGFGVGDVAVVGAGPCGLAAAKYLLAQGVFDSVVVFEQQSEVGGVWNYSADPSRTLRVPQQSPFCPPDPPIRPPGTPSPLFPSPVYEMLHANIPAPLMQFLDLDFPKGGLIFPTREQIQQYLVEYSQDVRHVVKFCTQIKDIRLRQEGGKDRWDLDAESTVTGEVFSRTFDAVVVASGHYSTTYIPDVASIEDFHRTNPGIITHSKSYRKAEAFSGKKVVVVGNAASGLDIATQVGRLSQQPLLLSVRSPTPPDKLERTGCQEVPVIVEFLPAERGVKFRGGRVETDIDSIIFCTGYLFSYPFLRGLGSSGITDGRRVYGLHRDLIHIDHSTIAFAGLPMKVVPFPLSESQGAILARVWSDALALPSKEAMRRWEDEMTSGRGPAFHAYPKGGDIAYINETYDWISRASPSGKPPPRWNEERVWMRQIGAEAKLEFERSGCAATSLDELGFHYSHANDQSRPPQEGRSPPSNPRERSPSTTLAQGTRIDLSHGPTWLGCPEPPGPASPPASPHARFAPPTIQTERDGPSQSQDYYSVLPRPS